MYKDYEDSYIYGDIKIEDLENVIDLEKFNKIVTELMEFATSKCDCSDCNGKIFLNNCIVETVLQEVVNKFDKLTKIDKAYNADYRVRKGEVFFYREICEDNYFRCDSCEAPYRNEDLEKKEGDFHYCKECSSEED